MRSLLLTIVVLIISCSSTKQSIEAPSVGTLWDNPYGYTEVYTVPEILPKPKVGVRKLLNNVNSSINGITCSSMSPFSFLMVIDEEGSVIGIHNSKRSEDPCFIAGALSITDYEFYPAQLSGKPVKSLMSIRVVPQG
jgi:hypothetical protein